MPPTARNSSRRRRKNADEEVPERAGESSAQVMAPTRMKLRVRRCDNAATAAAGGGGEPDRSREGSRSSSRRKNATKNAATVAAAASSSSTPPAPSASARALMAAEEASPDSKCPICLDRFNNLAYLDRCLHRFCFPCIQEWSHNKAECPLCKQPFASILHSVRAEDDFKEYTLRPTPANSSVAATVAMVAAMASAARSDHHMRLMLRRHRVADGGETTTRRRRRERGGRGRGTEERPGVWQWYLGSPPLPLPPLPHHFPVSNIVPEDSEEGVDLRGGGDAEERGVVFDGLTGLGGASARPNDRSSERLMTRLAERLQLQGEGRPVTRLREREMLAFRRSLYRFGIRVRGVPGITGNQGQQQRDITADSFRRTPSNLNRLRPWLRRELTVLYGAHGSLVDIVQRIIMARLARHGLEDMPTIEAELRPFLLARTEHFLHELVNFARSPLNLDGYDVQAVYEPTATNIDLDRVSSSSDGSSVIAISEGEEEERGGGSEQALNDDVTQTESALSLSGWDDETPGPSYSTGEPSCSLPPFSPAPQEPANEDGGEKEGEEECLIVGYKKPIAERTPELVQLSSDTEEEEKKEEQTSEKAPPSLYLPIIPASTSASFQKEEEARQKHVQEESEQRPRAHSLSGSSGRSRKSVCSLSPPSRKQLDGEAARERRRRKKRRKKGRDRSGTLYNPNRSIYPAMMRRRSPSPFHSSIDSSSPLPPSPLDSSWDFHCNQISPLSSSISSPSRSMSSSPLCSSPPPRTPPTPTLSSNECAHHGEKPGGKRKYKSRHLDSDSKDPSRRPSSGHHGEKRRKRGRDGGRRKEKQRGEGHKENRSFGGESSRRSREDRSPSVEIIYEGIITSTSAQPPARKRRRRRHRRIQHSSSPVIITLDSDSSHDDANNKMNSGSSSPLSSQQTVDFSDLPPLPTGHSTTMGGNLDAELGELPADILDRGSDGSEAESLGPSRAAGRIDIDSDDSDVDVEKVEDAGFLMTCSNDETVDDRKVSTATVGGREHPSDRNLLATILSDLNQLSASSRDFSLNTERRCDPGEAYQNRNQNQTGCSSASSPPPPELLKDVSDLLPLLRPLRNSPPPLKHKDTGTPPFFPRDLHPLPSSDPDPVLLGPDKRAIPPIATLKRHLANSLSLREELPSTSITPPTLTTPRHLPRLDFTFPSAESHSSCNRTDPGNSSASRNSHSAKTSWSTDRPAFTSSTSGGGVKTESLAGLHPSACGGVFSGANSNDAIPVPPAGPGSSSGRGLGPSPGPIPGLSSKKQILLGRVRSVPTEASSSSSPTNLHPKSPKPPSHLHPESPGPPSHLHPENPGPPSDLHPENPSPPSDLHPERPGRPSDLHSESPGPPSDLHPERPGPPSDLHSESPGPPSDLLPSIAASGQTESHIPTNEHPNHAALSPCPTEHIINSHTSHTKGTSGLKPGRGPLSNLLPQPRNHCEPGSDLHLHPKLHPHNHITSDSKLAENRSGLPPDPDSLIQTL
ncbi:E3 ubiquitin-protein ligase Topors-like isoform X2 [Melanotaenia boesemani]|uniref:E3 ubiquitin-protein ligase Topors-like isoform X2 n=1 Tax=Melanotaenia boesemani TaxID=1250792 RepID=UPI001C05D32C|nr:E3 ubiquitin-protein ligase Topors-like isoform X2 [Melanotaenia boesemani]